MDIANSLLSSVHDGNAVPPFAPIVAEIVDRSRRSVEKNLPLFIIVQYDHESDKISFQEKLKKTLVQEGLRVREFDPVHNEAHGTGKLYPLLAKASAENAVCLVFGLPRTDGEIRADHEFVHYLNIYRDRIVHERIRMILMLPARDAEQFIFSAGDLWDFRHATYWLERPAIKSSDFQWSRMETQTAELPLPEPDMAEIQTHIRNTRPLIDETHDPLEKAKLYLQLCQWLERRNAVSPALEAALEGLQELNDDVSETRAELEFETGNLLEKKDQFAEAARHLKTCLMLNETCSWGNTKSKAKCLEKLGYVQMRMDDLSGAKSSYGAALPIYREIGDRLGEANCLQSQGLLVLIEGKPVEAFGKFLEVRAIFEFIQDGLGQQAALGYLARTAHSANSPDQGLLIAEASLEIGRKIDSWFGQSINLKLQLQIWQEVQEVMPFLAVLMILRDLFAQIGNPQEAAQYAVALKQIQSQLPPEAFQAIEADPESIRAAAIAEARERFAKTGRDLLDPPPEPE